MENVDHIKREIERLYKTNPNIHISVRSSRPRILVDGTSAVITGVYRNLFQIEENDSGLPTKHTIQYGDVLIGKVVIKELEFNNK